MPKRIQRKRDRGWKIPPNTVYVGRPSPWGNPWTIKKALESGLFKPDHCAQVVVDEYRSWLTKNESLNSEHLGIYKTLESRRRWILDHIQELTGKNLACWCMLDQPCHADVLLELANPASEITHQCRHPGCQDQAISCTIYDHDLDKEIIEWYCPEHAPEYGYCCLCGQFWGGIEAFEFAPIPGLCPNCCDQVESDCDDDNYENEDDWLEYWNEYPGDLLPGSINFIGDEEE